MMATRPIPAAPYPTSRSTRTTHSATFCTTVDPGGRPALARSSDSICPHRGGYGRCAVRAHSCADCLCDMSSRSEEHTSELQSRGHLVCRLLLEKKNNHITCFISLSTSLSV